MLRQPTLVILRSLRPLKAKSYLPGQEAMKQIRQPCYLNDETLLARLTEIISNACQEETGVKRRVLCTLLASKLFDTVNFRMHWHHDIYHDPPYPRRSDEYTQEPSLADTRFRRTSFKSDRLFSPQLTAQPKPAQSLLLTIPPDKPLAFSNFQAIGPLGYDA